MEFNRNVFKLREFQELATQVMLEKYGTPKYAQAHIEHLEDVNKEYWETHFYNKDIDAFDIDMCADYHKVSLSYVGVKLREFNIDMRIKYSSKNEYDIKQYLESLNIKCVVFNKLKIYNGIFMNNRDHRKITVIDGKIAYTGGLNFSDEYINKLSRFGYWKDNAIKLEGDSVWNLTVMFLNYESFKN